VSVCVCVCQSVFEMSEL